MQVNLFYAATNCECLICYNQGFKYYTNPCYNSILWFFSKVQISANYEKSMLKFVVLCITLAEQGIILLFATEITCVKRIILESNRQCTKDLSMISTNINFEWDEFYTDISCLGGVFAKNTSRETKNFPSRMAREI